VLGLLLAISGYPQEAEPYLKQSGSNTISLMTLAIVYGQQNRHVEAQAVLQRTPGAALALKRQGEAAYSSGQHSKALALLEMSLALDGLPDRDKTDVYRRLSILYEAVGNREEAIRYAQLWVDLGPQDLYSSIWLTSLYLWEKRVEDAYLVLQQAETLGVRSHRFFPEQMGYVYDLRGDLERAIPLYREGVARNPDDPFSNWYLGQALYRQGCAQEAIPYLELAQRSSYPNLQLAAQDLLSQIAMREQDMQTLDENCQTGR